MVLDKQKRSHEESLALMSIIDVLLHPAKTEGFGLPVLEAQNMGIPVITSSFSAMQDFTFYGKSIKPLSQETWLGGGFVPIPNKTGFVEALTNIFQDKRALIGKKKARRYIQTNMNVHSVTKRFLEIGDSLLKEKHNTCLTKKMK